MLQLALAHDKTKKAHSISKQSYTFKQELYIHQNEENDTNTTTKQASDKTFKKEGLKQIKRNWENKPLRGKYPLRSQKADVDHLVYGCHIMSPTEYLQRNDRVGRYIHWKICQHYNAPYTKNWYEHKPQKVVEIESATILWNFFIHTDRTIQSNKTIKI